MPHKSINFINGKPQEKRKHQHTWHHAQQYTKFNNENFQHKYFTKNIYFNCPIFEHVMFIYLAQPNRPNPNQKKNGEIQSKLCMRCVNIFFNMCTKALCGMIKNGRYKWLKVIIWSSNTILYVNCKPKVIKIKNKWNITIIFAYLFYTTNQ